MLALHLLVKRTASWKAKLSIYSSISGSTLPHYKLWSHKRGIRATWYWDDIFEVIWALRKRPLCRPSTQWCGHISQQVQEHVGIPQAGVCYWKNSMFGLAGQMDGCIGWRSTVLWKISESNNYSWTVFAQRHQSKCQLTIYFSPSSVFCILHFSWHSYQEAYSGNKVQTQHPRHYKQSTVNTASVKSTVLKQE